MNENHKKHVCKDKLRERQNDYIRNISFVLRIANFVLLLYDFLAFIYNFLNIWNIIHSQEDEDLLVVLCCKKLQEFRGIDNLRIGLGLLQFENLHNLSEGNKIWFFHRETLATCKSMSTIAKVIPRFKNLTVLDLHLA